MIIIIKGILLVAGIIFVALAVSTPGTQIWQSILGGIALGVFVGIDGIK